MIHRITVFDSFLERGRIHRAETLDVDPVRTVATDVEPLRRLVLHFGGRHRVELKDEPVILGKRLEQRKSLLAVRGVRIDQANLLAVYLIAATFLAPDAANESR